MGGIDDELTREALEERDARRFLCFALRGWIFRHSGATVNLIAKRLTDYEYSDEI
jgi:hypothetical protein